VEAIAPVFPYSQASVQESMPQTSCVDNALLHFVTPKVTVNSVIVVSPCFPVLSPTCQPMAMGSCFKWSVVSPAITVLLRSVHVRCNLRPWMSILAIQQWQHSVCQGQQTKLRGREYQGYTSKCFASCFIAFYCLLWLWEAARVTCQHVKLQIEYPKIASVRPDTKIFYLAASGTSKLKRNQKTPMFNMFWLAPGCTHIKRSSKLITLVV
jgi:hypothetical protein